MIIFKALNKVTDELVTIKQLEIQPESLFLQRLQRISLIDHPFIDKIRYFHIKDDENWLVSEYYQLGSIADILKMTGELMSEAEISCVCYNILNALDYIHILNLSHGNIRTTNILIDNRGQAKLADFGMIYM